MVSSFIKRPRKSNRKGISTLNQFRKIKQMFPNLKVLKQKGTYFDVVIKLRPTPLSCEYDVRICFDKFTGVKTYVINEKLKIAKNRIRLPHVYSHIEQRICLYSSEKNQWTKEKLIASTIIPWASEWLQFYELWLNSGDWLGGGHDEYRQLEKKKGKNV